MSIRQIEQLADALVSSSDSALTRGWARIAAESIFDLDLVRQVKLALMNRAAGEPTITVEDYENLLSTNGSWRVSEQQIVNITTVLPKLRALERYEKRCSSRRNRAIHHILVNN